MIMLLGLHAVALFSVACASAGSYSVEVQSTSAIQIVRHRSLSQAPTFAVRVADFLAINNDDFNGGSEFVDVPDAVLEPLVGIPVNTTSPSTDDAQDDETAALSIDSEQASRLYTLIASALVRAIVSCCACGA